MNEPNTIADRDADSPTMSNSGANGLTMWVTSHKAISITTTAVLVVAAVGIPVGINVAQNLKEQQLTAEAQSDYAAALAAYSEAEGSADATDEFLDEQQALYDTTYNAAYGIVKDQAALFNQESIDALAATVATYSELLTPLNVTPEDAEPTAEGEPVEIVWDLVTPDELTLDEDELVAKYLNEDTYADAKKGAQATTKEYQTVVADNQDIQDSFTEVSEQAPEDIVALAAAATPEVKDAYITTAAARSTPESQKAVADALAQVVTIADGTFEAQPDAETPVAEVTVIQAYVNAALAAKKSNDDVIAAEAAAKAAEEAARQSQNSGGGSGDSGGGNWGGGGSGGSGGSGGGSTGGGGGGGSTGGGGGGGSTPTPPRGAIVASGSDCFSSSANGASGNWTSNLMYPGNAASVWVTSENPGVSWSIGWSCF